MNKTYVAALALLLLGAPLAFAHAPLSGTPKNYCEDPSEWNVHDYGPPATGLLAIRPPIISDGNILGDCNGDGVPADFDGHSEFALGGAWLMADSGDGSTGGSVACYGEVAHHPFFGQFWAFDDVFGAGIPFTVASDTLNEVDPGTVPDCGDFTTDNHHTCFGMCIVTFPPGLDGAYIVYVGDVLTGAPGTLGHIGTGAVAPTGLI